MNRIPQLDGLRGIAISLVVSFHYGAGTLSELPFVSEIAHRGWIGVDLFFVMSGYLIGGIVLANREADNIFRVFYIRRVLRIFPLYYLLLAVVVVQHWVHPVDDTDGYPLWIYLVFLQNYVAAFTATFGTSALRATWSLAIEEQFYLLLPLAAVLLPVRQLTWLLIAGIVAAFGIRVLGYFTMEKPVALAVFLTQTRGDCLLYGVLLAILMKKKVDFLRRNVTLLYVAMSVLVSLFVFATADDASYVRSLFLIAFSVTGPICFCATALAIIHERGPISVLTRGVVIRWIGVLTYAIFLLHIPVLSSVRAAFRAVRIENAGLVTLSSLVLTLALATLSWHLLERPLIRFGHSFKYRFGEEPEASRYGRLA